MQSLTVSLFAAVAMIAGIPTAKAALFISFEQTAANTVTATVSGSFNTSSANLFGAGSTGQLTSVDASTKGFFNFYNLAPINVYVFSDSQAFGPTTWGPGSYVYGSYISGSVFTFTAAFLYTPSDYVSGAPLNSVAQFNGTIESLGLYPNLNYTLVTTKGGISDTITVTTVPEPSTIGLVVLSLGLLSRRRRR